MLLIVTTLSATGNIETDNMFIENNVNGKWIIDTVDGIGEVGWYTDIAIVDPENVFISYYDIKWKNLKLANLRDSKCFLEVVDSIGDVGMYPSLAVDSSGNPHISYYDATNRDLKYAKWADSGWSIEVVDSQGDVGRGTSITLDIYGNPYVSYAAQWPGLLYAHRTEAGWSTNVVDSESRVYGSTSISIDSDSNPHIGYFDVGTAYEEWYLKYAYLINSKWNIEIVDPHIKGFWYEWGVSIAACQDEIIHIAYFKWTNEWDLNYAWRLNNRWSIETVDSEGAVGAYTSLDIDSDGYPHISYMDRSSLSLKYARKIQYCPSTPNKPLGTVYGKSGKEYTYTSYATDFDGDKIRYGWDWDGDFIVDEYTGFFDSGELIRTSHMWENGGTYQIQVIAEDENGHESEWSNSLPITMPKNKQITNNDNNPPNPPEITGPLFGKVGEVYFYYFTVTDPDEDDGLWELEIDFGDEIIIERSCDSGECVPWKNGETVEIKHMWKRTGTYELTARVMDVYGELSEWSDPLSVSMPKNKPYINTPFLQFLENHPHMFPLLRQLLGLQ